jgi:hypothetical protein
MVEFSTREKSMFLVMVTQWLGRLHKGKFEPREILNLAESLIWRIDFCRNSTTEHLSGYEYETFLLRGYVTLDDYIRKTIEIHTGKQLHEFADEWYGCKDYQKYFGDFS